MNNKGFTLIELLGVIVVLGVITAIAVPGISLISKNIQNNMLDKKITLIESAATLLGEDIKSSIIDSNLKYENYPCRKFYISSLVPDYLDKDNENECNLCEERNDDGSCQKWTIEDNKGCIVDPSDNNKYLDKLEVIIYYKNNKINAKVDKDNNLTCS